MVKAIEGRSFRNKTMTRLLKPLLIVASLASLAIPSLAAADPDRRGQDRAHWEQREDRRDERRHERRDDRDRYAPPPRAFAPPMAYGYDSYRHDHGRRHWQRGQYMSPYVRTYVVYDYGRHRLRPPPRGFVWVRADHDYLLVATATGLIFDVIRGGW
jgi:Ni/Co efflux regulator RcnB